MKNKSMLIVIMCLGTLMPLKGMESENTPTIEMVTDKDVSLLRDIIKQAAKCMRVKNSVVGHFAEERIRDLMNELSPLTREKIVDDIQIIISHGDPFTVIAPPSAAAAAPKRMKKSVAAYRNLSDLLKAMAAQAHLIKVAQEQKELVENASAQEKSSVVNTALNKIKSATQVAQKAVSRLSSRAQNMLKLSEDNVALRIDLLRQIVMKASLLAKSEDRKIGFTWNPSDEEIREMGKKGLSQLMGSNLLDTAIRNAIMPDIQVLLDTTDKTLEASQKAYERLLITIEGVDKEGTSIIAMIKQGKELVQNTPISNLQKVSDFVTVQILNIENLLGNIVTYGFSSAYRGFTTLSGGLGLVDVLTYPTTERKFVHILQVCFACEMICDENSSWRSEYKQNLNDLMKDPILDEETRKAMAPDIQIVLATTDETKEESKKACERLRNLAETYRPYLRKAVTMVENTISSGLSKMGSLVQSVKDVAYNHPGAAVVITGAVIGTLIKNFSIFVRDYKFYKQDSIVYTGIVQATIDAYKKDDMSKYHTLRGILESLGVEITEDSDYMYFRNKA